MCCFLCAVSTQSEHTAHYKKGKYTVQAYIKKNRKILQMIKTDKLCTVEEEGVCIKMNFKSLFLSHTHDNKNSQHNLT